MTQGILKVVGLSKSFNGLRVLNDINFEVSYGELVGISGPNNAGKTTLLNLISGYLRPDKGSIIFKGKDVTGLPPYKLARIGMARTFQQTRNFPSLTVLENVKIVVGQKYASSEYVEKKSLEMLKKVGLLKFANMKASYLSYACARILQLARALALEPELLLLDEIFAGVDSIRREKIISLIKSVNKSGVTIIVTAASMPREFVRTLSRMFILCGGTVKESENYHNPV